MEGCASMAAARSAKRRSDSVAFVERELVQSQLGQIQARTAASRAYLRQTMSALLDQVDAGCDLEATRVDFRLACTFASQSALWAIDVVTEMAGAAAITGKVISQDDHHIPILAQFAGMTYLLPNN